MGMTRAEKQAEIEVLKSRFDEDELMVVTHYSGMTVADMDEFRANGREAGATIKVTKNSLAKIALKGTKFEGTTDLFSGPTSVVSSVDEVAAAKVAHEYAKKNDKLIIIGGAMGEKILSVEEVKALASMPSLDELRSKLVGLLQAPAQKMVGVLQAPARELVGVTKAYGDKAE